MKYNAEQLRRKYPKGTKVVLEHMEGEPQMKEGLVGKVKFVDDIGQIHVSWENGSSLALNVDVDRFQAKREPLAEKISGAASRGDSDKTSTSPAQHTR